VIFSFYYSAAVNHAVIMKHDMGYDFHCCWRFCLSLYIVSQN